MHNTDTTNAPDWRAIREAAGLSGETLARRLGFSLRTIWRFERGAPDMGKLTRSRLALAYHQLAAQTAATLARGAGEGR